MKEKKNKKGMGLSLMEHGKDLDNILLQMTDIFLLFFHTAFYIIFKFFFFCNFFLVYPL